MKSQALSIMMSDLQRIAVNRTTNRPCMNNSRIGGDDQSCTDDVLRLLGIGADVGSVAGISRLSVKEEMIMGIKITVHVWLMLSSLGSS